MSNLAHLIPIIQSAEGGFSNHRLDHGGATMCGITLYTYKAWRKVHLQTEPTTADLKNITPNEWTAILRQWYWNPWQADQIQNQSVADILVDFGWGSGVRTAIADIQQRVLHIKADGICGPLTLKVINQYPSQEVLFNAIKAERQRYFEAICQRDPSQCIFLRGWQNRLNRFIFKA